MTKPTDDESVADLEPASELPDTRNKKAWAKPKQDVANKDAFVGAGGYSLPQKVNVTYLAVFDTEEQLKLFHHYMRLLKKAYPEVRTIGGRIGRHLMEVVVPPLEAAHGKARKKTGRSDPVGHAPQEEVEIVKEEV